MNCRDDPNSPRSSILICCTCPPGMEQTCLGELAKKLVPLGAGPPHLLDGPGKGGERGKVLCPVDLAQTDAALVPALLSLRSVERLYACVLSTEVSLAMAPAKTTKQQLGCVEAAVRAVAHSSWDAAVALVELCNSYRDAGKMESAATPAAAKEIRVFADALASSRYSSQPFTFRVYKRRGGVGHKFTSSELGQAAYRGISQSMPCWTGTLENEQLSMYVHLHEARLLVCLALSATAIWRDPAGHGIATKPGDLSVRRSGQRALGVANLKPSIAYGMLEHAILGSSCILLDPLAGSGTILELAAAEYPGAVFCLAGDHDMAACKRAWVNGGGKVDVVRWDATRLPLRGSCIDRVVTDLPFGKRCGSRAENTRLYPAVIAETDRVLRPKQCSRAVLLSADRNAVVKLALGREGKIGRLQKHREFSVNVGGLNATCMVLRRICEDEPRAARVVQNRPGSMRLGQKQTAKEPS